MTAVAAYLPMDQKIPVLGKTISKLDLVKFFIQMSWEIKLVANNQYVEMAQKLETIGRDLGSWKKTLEQKLPPK